MSKKTVGKKLKIWALIINILPILPALFVQVIIYEIANYNNKMALDYIPVKYVVIADVILLILILIPFFIKKNYKATIVSVVMSSILIITLTTVSVLGVLYKDDIKNLISKADKIIDTIVDNSKSSTDEYGVYVLKTDKAENIEDAKTYIFGFNIAYAKEDIEKVIDGINAELKSKINTIHYQDASSIAQSLYDGKSQAVILNQPLIDIIESAGDESDDGEKNGHHSDFSSRVKCIYRFTISNKVTSQGTKKDITSDWFNVYISGIDTTGSVTTKSRSDVNIIMSVNPKTKQILLLSTPRDCYVPLSISGGVKDKLTHAGIYGIDVSMNTLEMFYGIQFDYYVRMNFTGFTDIIDALGGIDIESDYAFYAKGYNYSKGMNNDVNGAKALVFARERHAFAEGDNQRGKNQMRVIEAVIKKCASASILNNYTEILENVSESFQTSVSKKNIQKFVKFQLSQSPKWNIFTHSITGSGQSNYTYSIPNARSYVMIPNEVSITKAKSLIKDVEDGKMLAEQEKNNEGTIKSVMD